LEIRKKSTGDISGDSEIEITAKSMVLETKMLQEKKDEIKKER
jgi:hypothetical protein